MNMLYKNFDELLDDARKFFHTAETWPDCPPEDVLFDYVHDDLSQDEYREIKDHIEQCEACRVLTLKMDADRIESEMRLEDDPAGFFEDILGPDNETMKDFIVWAERQGDDSKPENMLTQLKGWFQGVFSEGWQPADLVPAYRGAEEKDIEPLAKQAKIFHMGEYKIAVCIKLTPLENDEVDVCMELYPEGDTKNLPPGLKVVVTDQTEDVFMEEEAGEADIFLRLTWIREAGDRYRIKMIWNNIETEERLT